MLIKKLQIINWHAKDNFTFNNSQQIIINSIWKFKIFEPT